MRRIVLNVAEKPKIATTIVNFLKRGETRKEQSDSQFNPVVSFRRKFMTDEEATLKVTSVTGHIMEIEFDQSYSEWSKVDPLVLIESAQIHRTHSKDKLGIVKNLKRLAREATDIVLWLDCDREGEAIAYEVLDICQRENRSLIIHRARFSAATKSDIERAFNNLQKPMKGLSDAVEARQEIDLRIGAAFTRLQTMTMRKEFSQDIIGKVVSYGPCQMPTLGFVVDRYIEVRDFIPEDFWFLQLLILKQGQNSNKPVNFTWDRTRLYDKKFVQACFLMSKTLSDGKAFIKRVRRDRKTKTKPLPLTTVKMQKLGTSKLRMSSHQIMSIAEKLYTKGFISYPRTETDQFDKSIDLRRLVSNLIEFPDNQVREFVEDMVQREGFEQPRKGPNNDHAHPPIHPVKPPSGLTPEEYKVYNMVAKHFLACCSKDAVGEQTRVEAEIGEEGFHVSGIVVVEKNYLKIYEPFDFWGGVELPKFMEGESIVPSDYSVKQSRTTPPELLTEADLIGMMEKHNIGTDSTIHEHIKTIQDRKYAFKQGQVFKPSNLGVSIVECYNNLGIDLAKPRLRAEMEKDMGLIAKGEKTKEEVVIKYQSEMAMIYKEVEQKKIQFVQSLAKYITKNSNLNGEKAEPEEGMEEVEDDDANNDDASNIRLPKSVQPSSHRAPVEGGGEGSIPRLGVKRIGPCTACGEGSIVVKPKKAGGFFLACTAYPKCQTAAGLPPKVSKAEMTETKCAACSKAYSDLIYKVKLSFEDKSLKTGNYCLMCSDKLVGYKYTLRTKQDGASTNQFREVNSSSMPCPPPAQIENSRTAMVCYKCGKPGHYSNNCDEQIQAPPGEFTFPQGPPVKKPAMSCSNCGKTNHFTHQCFAKNGNQQSKPTTRPDDLGQIDDKTTGFGEKTCYRCGKPGHYANNCPSKQEPSSNTYNNGSKMTSTTCYKCHQQGHYASNCPNR